MAFVNRFNQLIILCRLCLYISLIVNGYGSTSHISYGEKFDLSTDPVFADMVRNFKKKQQKQLTTASPFAMIHYVPNQPIINHSIIPHVPDIVEPLPDHIEYMDALKPPEHTCQNIQIDMCKNIGYNVTSMPNFVGHEMQTEAEIQLHSFLPLISYGCSSQLKFFLCSAYVPMCTEKVPVLIGPCRPLCERIKSRCGPILYELGFEWPAGLNCSMFVPKNTVDHMCMEGPEPLESELEPLPPLLKNNAKLNRLRAQLGHGNTNSNFKPSLTNYDNIYQNNGHQHFSSVNAFNENKSDLNIDHRIFLGDTEQSLNGNQRLNDANLMRFNEINQKKCSKYKNSTNYIFLEHPRPRCVAKCQSDVLYSGQNKSYMEYWSSVWSCISIISCLLTIVVFWISPPKYLYPERAIFYIAICYLFYSIPYIYRSFVGRETLSCYPDGFDNNWLLVQEGAHNPHCTISFFLFYYFGMAAIIWWLVLVLSWTLSISFGWSLDQLAQNRQIYHTVAWTLPGLQTLTALVVRAVDADELTGTCYIGAQNDENLFKFIIVPMTIYICIGIVLLVFGFLSIRISFNKKHKKRLMHSNQTHHYFVPTNGQISSNNPHYQSATTHQQLQPLNLSTKQKYPAEDLICLGSDSNSLLFSAGGSTAVQQCSSHTTKSHFLSTNGPNCYHNALMTNSPNLNIRSSLDGIQNHKHHCTDINNAMLASSITCSLSTTSSASTSLTNHSLGANNDQMEHALCSKSSSASSNNDHLEKYLQTKQKRQLARKETDKKHTLIRSSIFAILYILPVICVLITYIYEYCYRQQWLLKDFLAVNRSEHKVFSATNNNSVLENNTDTMILMKSIDNNADHINIDMINIRLFMSLIIGIKTGIWIILSRLPIALFRFLFSRYIKIKILPYYHRNGDGIVHRNVQLSHALDFQLAQQKDQTNTNKSIATNHNVDMDNVDNEIFQFEKTKNNTTTTNNNNSVPISSLIDQHPLKTGHQLVYNNNGSHQLYFVDQNSSEIRIGGNNNRTGQHNFNPGINETTFHCLNGSTLSTTVSSQLSAKAKRNPASSNNNNVLKKTIKPLMAFCQPSTNPQPMTFPNQYLNNNNNSNNNNNNNYNNNNNHYNQCCRCGGNETAV